MKIRIFQNSNFQIDMLVEKQNPFDGKLNNRYKAIY